MLPVIRTACSGIAIRKRVVVSAVSGQDGTATSQSMVSASTSPPKVIEITVHSTVAAIATPDPKRIRRAVETIASKIPVNTHNTSRAV